MRHKSEAAWHVGILVETEDTWGRNIVESVCRFGQNSGWTVLIAPRDQQGRLRLPAAWNGHGVIAALRNRSALGHVRQLQLPVVDVSNTMKKEDWLARVTTDDRARRDGCRTPTESRHQALRVLRPFDRSLFGGSLTRISIDRRVCRISMCDVYT